MPHPDMSESWANGHPDEGLLHEWLDDQLSSDHAKAVEAHVADCAECAALVAEARGLIAASHRILSALDDVPANVIPAQLPSIPADKSVVSLASVRTVQELRRETARTHASKRWRGLGKVAALLLIVLIPGYALLRGDGTLPLSLPKADLAAESSAAGVATAAPEARSVSAANSVANPSGVGAADGANRQRFTRELQKTAEPERAPSRPAAASRAEADRRVAAAPTASTASDLAAKTAQATTARATVAQASIAQATIAQANVLADSLASSRAQLAAGATLLSGRVAGVAGGSATGSGVAASRPLDAAPMAAPPAAATGGAAVASNTPPANATRPVATPPAVAADQVSLRSGAGGGRGGGAIRSAETSPATPIPHVANAPGVTMANIAPAARADSGRLSREIADAARRLSAGASSDSANRLREMLSGLSAPLAAQRALPAVRATFDSVTLTRTVCRTACETAVLHVSNLGAVRYSVSSGSTTKPAVSTQLSPADRQRIGELLGAAISESVSLAGQHRCTVSRVTGAPALEVVIANGAGNGARAEAACTTTSAVLLQLGAAIDSVAGTDALRRRIP